jgi:uncharacterized membrane protein
MTLSILILFSNNNFRYSNLLFIFFFFCMAVSHYATSFIFLCLLLIIWLLSRFRFISGIIYTKIGNNLILTALSFFLLWNLLLYSQFTIGASRTILKSFNNLQEFLLLETKSETVAIMMGAETHPEISYKIALGLSLFTKFAILIGLLILFLKLRKREIPYDFFLFSMLSFFLLIIGIILPYISQSYNLERLFLQNLIFLSPACIIGVIFLFRRIFLSRWKYIITMIVIIQFTLSTGFLSQIMNEKAHANLNNFGPFYDKFFTHDQ